MRGDYRQNQVWDLVMLFANAVLNVFTGVFDVRNCVFRVLDYVRQNIAVVFARSFDYSLRIMFFAYTWCCSILCYADCDSIIRVSNYVLPDPGLQGDRPL